MINNRQQAGRRRGRGGGNPGGGGQRQGNPGRPDNGNRIDSRARGNASQLYEKYKNMASDAQRQGDRVNTEYYLQFADHYFRVLSEQRGRFEEQPRRQRDDFDDGNGEFDGDEFGDAPFANASFANGGEPARANDGGDGAMAPRFDRDDRPQGDGRQQGEARQQTDGRQQGEARQQRDDRPRDERPRNDGQRSEARSDAPRAEARDDRPRGERDGARRDGNGDARPRGEWQERPPRRERRPDQARPEQPRADAEQATDPLPEQRVDPVDAPVNWVPEPRLVEVAGQRRADPMTPGETLEGRAEEVLEADRPLDAPPPRRRGRPRRDAKPVTTEPSGAAEANGFEADRLPPALTPTLTAAANDEAPVKPRRRRVRVEETPDAAE